MKKEYWTVLVHQTSTVLPRVTQYMVTVLQTVQKPPTGEYTVALAYKIRHLRKRFQQVQCCEAYFWGQNETVFRISLTAGRSGLVQWQNLQPL